MFALVWVFFMYLLMALYKKEYQASWTADLMQYTSFFLIQWGVVSPSSTCPVTAGARTQCSVPSPLMCHRAP